MKAFIISLSKIENSYNLATQLCRDLSDINIDAELFEGTYGDEAVRIFKEEGRVYDTTLLPKHRAKKPGQKGCFYSHYRLWKKCVDLDEPILIFEDDVKIDRPFIPVEFKDVLVVSTCPHWPEMWEVTKEYLELPSEYPTAINFIKPKMPGASGYAIKPCAAKKLVDYYKNSYTVADYAINSNIVKIQITTRLIGRSMTDNEGKVSLTKADWRLLK